MILNFNFLEFIQQCSQLGSLSRIQFDFAQLKLRLECFQKFGDLLKNMELTVQILFNWK